jgi:hypothetical protein
MRAIEHTDREIMEKFQAQFRGQDTQLTLTARLFGIVAPDLTESGTSIGGGYSAKVTSERWVFSLSGLFSL